MYKTPLVIQETLVFSVAEVTTPRNIFSISIPWEKVNLKQNIEVVKFLDKHRSPSEAMTLHAHNVKVDSYEMMPHFFDFCETKNLMPLKNLEQIQEFITMYRQKHVGKREVKFYFLFDFLSKGLHFVTFRFFDFKEQITNYRCFECCCGTESKIKPYIPTTLIKTPSIIVGAVN